MNYDYKDKVRALQFQELSHQYEMMGICIWDWDFPEDVTIPEYIPEQTLYRQGQACMIKIPGTEDYGIFPVAYGSIDIDLYGRPMTWRAYTVGNSALSEIISNTRYSSTEVPGTEPSVLIWNDFMRHPTKPYVDMLISRMINTDIALETNINAQKTPIIISTDEQNKLTAKNFAKLMYEDANFIFKSNAYNGDNSIDVINLGVQFIGDKLSDQYRTFENRILEYLGIDNLPVEKQERMLTGEISSNDDKTELMGETRLYMRERATEEMADIFGIDVEVKKRELSSSDSSGMYGTSGLGGENRDVGEEGGPERQQD